MLHAHYEVKNQNALVNNGNFISNFSNCFVFRFKKRSQSKGEWKVQWSVEHRKEMLDWDHIHIQGSSIQFHNHDLTKLRYRGRNQGTDRRYTDRCRGRCYNFGHYNLQNRHRKDCLFLGRHHQSLKFCSKMLTLSKIFAKYL